MAGGGVLLLALILLHHAVLDDSCRQTTPCSTSPARACRSASAAVSGRVSTHIHSTELRSSCADDWPYLAVAPSERMQQRPGHAGREAQRSRGARRATSIEQTSTRSFGVERSCVSPRSSPFIPPIPGLARRTCFSTLTLALTPSRPTNHARLRHRWEPGLILFLWALILWALFLLPL